MTTTGGGGAGDDPLLLELRALPGAALPVELRDRTLARAESEMGREAIGRGRAAFRWLAGEVLVPAALLLTGVLYAGGALHHLARVYGPSSAGEVARAGDRCRPVKTVGSSLVVAPSPGVYDWPRPPGPPGGAVPPAGTSEEWPSGRRRRS